MGNALPISAVDINPHRHDARHSVPNQNSCPCNCLGLSFKQENQTAAQMYMLAQLAEESLPQACRKLVRPDPPQGGQTSCITKPRSAQTAASAAACLHGAESWAWCASGQPQRSYMSRLQKDMVPISGFTDGADEA